MKITAKTDVGLIRSTNEDNFIIEKKDDKNFIAFTCDGMGGHLGGSFASSKTCDVIKEEFDKLDPNKIKSIGVWLYETLQKANEEIYQGSLTNENYKGMGTTASGVLMINGELFYAHVGDSRIYRYSPDVIEQITTDHTYVNTLLLNGAITYKQAIKHPKRHILTNAVGIKREISVDIGQIKLKEGQNILICSDGLHNLLDGQKLLKALYECNDVEDKAEHIISKALSLGGSDNITLVLVEF